MGSDRQRGGEATWRHRAQPGLARLILLMAAGLASSSTGAAQTAVISDAWWTFQQDCSGDGSKAGTLEGNFARLNWAADVANCNGTLNVYEKVYYRPCGTDPWTPIYTNAAHSITGCRTVGQQYVDISLGAGGECRDYMIEIFRVGHTTPDARRSSTNGVDLAQHREQWLAEDFCRSDFFTTCVTLAGAVGTQSDNNAYATKEPGEPDHAGNPGGRSLWYCWTATTNTPVTFDTGGSAFDTVLAVYVGDSLPNLTWIGSNDDIAGATHRQSQVTFTPTPGTTYRIAVDGFNNAVGNAVLNINPPANDDFADAFELSGLLGGAHGHTIGASKESGEPAHAFDVGGYSVWYQWTAPASGPVDFNTSGSNFDTTLAVYTDHALTNLTLIAANEDDAQGGGRLTSRLSFTAIEGVTYRIAVEGFGGVWGEFQLNWNMESRLGIARMPGGALQLTLTGVDWQRYTLLESGDLASWSTNTPPITMSGGTHQYTNAPAPNGPTAARQFFRAVLVP